MAQGFCHDLRLRTSSDVLNTAHSPARAAPVRVTGHLTSVGVPVHTPVILLPCIQGDDSAGFLPFSSLLRAAVMCGNPASAARPAVSRCSTDKKLSLSLQGQAGLPRGV